MNDGGKGEGTVQTLRLVLSVAATREKVLLVWFHTSTERSDAVEDMLLRPPNTKV